MQLVLGQRVLWGSGVDSSSWGSFGLSGEEALGGVVGAFEAEGHFGVGGHLCSLMVRLPRRQWAGMVESWRPSMLTV